MLNEKALAQQYLKVIDDNNPITDRFKYNVYVDNQSTLIGVKSILTYIARYYLFDKNYSQSDVRYLLSAYCGQFKQNKDKPDDTNEESAKKPDYVKDFDPNSVTDEDLLEEIEKIKNYIPNMIDHLDSKKSDKTIKKKEIKSKFLTSAENYNFNKPRNENSDKDFTSYIRIISNAINLGPLKNYYLCIEKKKLDNFFKKYVWICFKKAQAGDKLNLFEHIIKTLGAYYLSKLDDRVTTHIDGREYTLVYIYDIESYYNKGSFNQGYLKSPRDDSKVIMYNYFSAFKPFGNINFICLSKEVEALDAKLVEENDFNNNIDSYKNYYIFRDIDGSTAPLQMATLNDKNEFEVIKGQEKYIDDRIADNKLSKEEQKKLIKELENHNNEYQNKVFEDDQSDENKEDSDEDQTESNYVN